MSLNLSTFELKIYNLQFDVEYISELIGWSSSHLIKGHTNLGVCFSDPTTEVLQCSSSFPFTRPRIPKAAWDVHSLMNWPWEERFSRHSASNWRKVSCARILPTPHNTSCSRSMGQDFAQKVTEIGKLSWEFISHLGKTVPFEQNGAPCSLVWTRLRQGDGQLAGKLKRNVQTANRYFCQLRSYVTCSGIKWHVAKKKWFSTFDQTILFQARTAVCTKAIYCFFFIFLMENSSHCTRNKHHQKPQRLRRP